MFVLSQMSVVPFVPPCTEPPPNVQMELRKRIWPNMRVPPPGIPAAYGSGLYPKEDLIFSYNVPIPTQMRERSLARMRQEENAFQQNKADGHKQFRRDNEHILRYCNICSESVSYVHEDMTVVSHSHYSSLQSRITSRTDFWAEYQCDSCQEPWHSAYSGIRYPVLCTSSTLNQWQGDLSRDRSKGHSFHIDTIGIPGGCVEDVHHAFIAEYGSWEKPVDVLLMCGFNNLLAGQPALLVIDEMERFKEDVLRLPNSSFAVCTLPLPPIITHLPNDNYQNSRDYTQEVIELNFGIKELNTEAGQRMPTRWAPQFHTWGLRSQSRKQQVGPMKILERLPSHQHRDWREQRPRHQLHLSENVRKRMGKAVEKYFKLIYNQELH